MVTWLESFPPIVQALLAGCFTWGITALGAALVFFTKQVRQALLDAMLGFAAGVMIAASVWSLLLPAIDYAEAQGVPGYVPAVIGFLLGYAGLYLADRHVPELDFGMDEEEEGVTEATKRRTTLLVLAMTVHNVPEGLAVGTAFGAAAMGLEIAGGATVGAAVALALGIGLQNFPEGVAVAMPLRREGVSLGRSFFYGQLSGFVEPISAVLGAAAVLLVRPALPYALAFAAGAMMFVVIRDLIPTSQREGHAEIATAGAMAGFVVMMTLDIALG